MSTTKAEQAVAYAALILADESIAITPEKLQTLLKTAGIENVEPIWTTLFAKALEGKNFKDILTTTTAAGPTVVGVPVAKSNDGDEELARDGVKNGEEEDGEDGEGSDDDDFGMSLFG